jgi:hypothetical protein
MSRLFNEKLTAFFLSAAIIPICLFFNGCYPVASSNKKAQAPKNKSERAASLKSSAALTNATGADIIDGVPADYSLLNNFPAPLKSGDAVKYQVNKTYGNLPLRFEINQGQVDSKVKFVSRAGGHNFFFTPDEYTLVFNKSASKNESEKLKAAPAAQTSEIVQSRAIKMKLVGANPNADVTGFDSQETKTNYFTEKDRKKWKTNIPNYNKVKYTGVYRGVDMIFYGNQRRLEYDIIISPKVNPQIVKIGYDGAQKLYIDKDGRLALVADGETLYQSKPVIYQEIDGRKKFVEGGYQILGKSTVGFKTGAYDVTKPLIIDPVMEYSTFYGGTGEDQIYDIALDAAGNIYATGSTNSANFPTTAGSFSTAVSGSKDAFILKINPSGTALIYSTYVGGAGDDIASGIGVDTAGNAYIAGKTTSVNFPTTLNSIQPVYGGGGSDAFVLSLNPQGNALRYATYLGGQNTDTGTDMALDQSGNAYIVGDTLSTNFPVASAFQTSFKGGYSQWGDPLEDLFVSKLDSNGSALIYSTYLGGYDADQSSAITIDSSGNAYVTGRTYSTDFPTVNAFQSQKADSYTDVFVSKLNSTGNALAFSTYLGGGKECYQCSAWNMGSDIFVDSAGYVYVTGITDSAYFPTTPGVFQPNRIHFNVWSAFTTKLNPSGGSLVFSTYLGGNGDVNPRTIAVDSLGYVFIAGVTTASDLPVANPWQGSFGGSGDVFITRFTPDASRLSCSTYYAPNGFDYASSLALDASGGVYVAGYTGGFGTYDGFVTKFSNFSSHSIAGRISRPDGTGIPNVSVQMSGTRSGWRTTDANGNYSFQYVEPNGNYTITPQSYPLVFLPASHTINSLTGNVVADFTVEVYRISGRITDPNGEGVGAATVTLSGNRNAVTTTNTNGDYSFDQLPGGSYTVTPSKPDQIETFTFSPSSYSLTLNSNQTANFSAASTITSSLNPTADAYVQDGTSANANFGAAGTLKVETDTKTGNGKNFDAYLKFNLSGINRQIQSAKLRIYAASSTTGSVTTSAYSVGAVNWVESGAGGINWTNKPARSASALTGASAAVTGTAFSTYELDVTNYIKSEKTAGRNTVSLALHNPSASTLFITANSREAATNKPQLIITTAGGNNIAPSVTMTAPANGTIFGAPANIAVSAAASDVDGSISKVDFYNGTTLIGSSTVPASGNTYSVNWSNVAAGGYVLSAIAFDDKGAPSVSAPVNIAVNASNNLPEVSVISPVNNSTFAVGTNINLAATAGDADGSIGKVEFFSGSTLIGTATTPTAGNTYSVTWNNAATGAHVVTAKATDNNNGTTTSTAINIKVVGQIGLSPTADAYVQDGTSATTNFGTAAELRTQASAATGSNRETYLKFDLTAATGINKAVLRLYGRLSDTTAGSVPVSVYAVTTTGWIESGSSSITWNTKPAAGATALAGTTVTGNTPQWYELDLTSYIQTEKAAGRNAVSFAIKGNANSSPYVNFNSRESSTNQPQLIMQTTQPRDVLMVVGSATLNTGDNAVKTRLQNLGFTVTVKAAGSTTSTSIKNTDADGKALVLVSSTVTPANVGTKLKNIPVPVLNWEFDLADDFAMTNTVSGTDFGTAASQTQAVIIAPAHALSAGLTGTVSLASAASTFSWGKPNANADKIAALTTDSTKPVIYGYDTGKAMFGGLESPARRVAVYLSDTTAASLTANGGELFDAAVKWAAQLNISPTISLLSPNSGAVGTAVTITGTNFGSAQAGGGVTFNGVAASVTGWSNNVINTVVPPGATTGAVVVTAGEISSSGATFTVNIPNADADGDGLPDAWEMQFFGNLNYGANDDPDGDGVTNLQEYLQGRNPTRGIISLPNAVDLKVYTQLEP